MDDVGVVNKITNIISGELKVNISATVNRIALKDYLKER